VIIQGQKLICLCPKLLRYVVFQYSYFIRISNCARHSNKYYISPPLQKNSNGCYILTARKAVYFHVIVK
jgi:hypothetical protein